MKDAHPFRSSLYLAIASALAGILAVFGVFDSVSGFPVVFTSICLVVGLLSLRSIRPRRSALGPALVLLGGGAVAIGGWLARGWTIEGRLVERRLEILTTLKGSSVPTLEGLDPLNVESAAWDEAASLTAEATLVTFWARWCSPCWREMEELEVLYREHKDRGLRVLAVTRYDHPEDQEARNSDFAKAQSFLENRGFTYPAAITDRDDIYRAYRVPSPPGLALVDSQGRVIDYAIGLGDARALMQKAVELVKGASAS